MIEFGRLPTIRGMASSTVGAKTRLVRIISAMTSNAILRRVRKVSQTVRINMALRTGHVLMLSRQFELKSIMTELFAESIYSIVTIQAGCAISLNVRLGKAGVDLMVAGLA